MTPAEEDTVIVLGQQGVTTAVEANKSPNLADWPRDPRPKRVLCVLRAAVGEGGLSNGQ